MRAADILQRRLRRHGSKSDDLRDALLAVRLAHVLDHFAAPPHAEIDVDIGHGNALGIQEALKQQVVLQRIDVGDPQRVAHQAARRRTAPRPHRHTLRARVMDEIPHDQEVACEAHLLDHLDFSRQALLVFRQADAASKPPCASRSSCTARATANPSRDHFFEIRIGGVAFGNLEFRKRIADALDFHVAALGDGHCAG